MQFLYIPHIPRGNIMSEEQLHKQSRQPILKDAAGNSPADSRRRLLKGTLAIPVIMTLHSGAALARTSNLVAAIQDPASAVKDENGDLLCVNPGSGGSDPRAESVGSDPRVDLGNGAFTTVDQTPNADGSPDLDTQTTVCQERGGILVSATAWNSIGPLPAGNSTTI